ncbi:MULTISPECIES: hypothetical protein [Pectobacterium]|nr:hypothetical protein [Pectobacterium sp. CFBP8739]
MSESRLWLLACIFLKQGWVMRCHCDSLSGYGCLCCRANPVVECA